MSDTPGKNIIAIFITIAATIFLIWAAVQWFNRDIDQAVSPALMQKNEISTFENLQKISHAQKIYKNTDWDNDGNKVYAMYFVHLWSSVSTKSEPIRINLIPKNLAFAMEPLKAVDGYYFMDLHEKTGKTSGNVPLNYQNQWAIMGLTVVNGQTGILSFLADQTGSIYINNARNVAPFYPEDPAATGWTKIDNMEQLRDFQKKISYPAAGPQK